MPNIGTIMPGLDQPLVWEDVKYEHIGHWGGCVSNIIIEWLILTLEINAYGEDVLILDEGLIHVSDCKCSDLRDAYDIFNFVAPV